MKLPVYLFCSLLLISSCSNRITNEAAVNAGVVMNLSANKTKISQSEKTVNLEIKVKNTSTANRYILDRIEFSAFEYSVFQLIIDKDKQKKIPVDFKIVEYRIPKLNDYKKLLPGDSLTFYYKLDFRTLIDESKEPGNINVDFGAYKIKVLYKDKYKDIYHDNLDDIIDCISQIKKRAVTFLESNTVEIEYVK